MRHIIVRTYQSEDLDAQLAYNTPGQALRAADAFVGLNPYRSAHLYLEGTRRGIYIHRHHDYRDFDVRLEALRRSINEMV